MIILASALGAALAAVTPATAAAPGASIEDIAREKLAAVTLVRSKARRSTAAIANGRLLHAYLSAATTNEAGRVKSRIVSSMKAMQARYGLVHIRILWRDGRRLAESGATAKGPGPERAARDALAQDPGNISGAIYGDMIHWTTRTDSEGADDLVVVVGQDLSTYERALLHGLGHAMHVIVINDRGRIVSDSDGTLTPGQPAIIRGLTLDAIRSRLGISGPAGAGAIELDGRPVRVALQSADGWTVIAMDKPVPGPDCKARTGVPCR